MAKIIKPADVEEDRVYEPPLVVGFGINSTTVEDPKLTMGLTVVPPGGRNQAHYHVKCAAGLFIKKGRFRVFIGPKHEQQEAIVEEGDFLYVDQGEIHGLVNLSDYRNGRDYFYLSRGAQ